MTMQNKGLARVRRGRQPKPYIAATSPEFLAILPAARAELEALELRRDGRPKLPGANLPPRGRRGRMKKHVTPPQEVADA